MPSFLCASFALLPPTGAGGGEREHKKAASKEVMALLFQLVPSSTDKIFICFCCYKVKMRSKIQYSQYFL